MRRLVFLILVFAIMPLALAIIYLWTPYPPARLELPTLKAGLWENVYDNGHMLWGQQGFVPNQVRSQQCVGPANRIIPIPYTESPGPCVKRDAQRSGDTVTIDSTCLNPIITLLPDRLRVLFHDTHTIRTVIKGSFDSAYTITEGEVTLTAKWLGPCAAAQKPGDIVYMTADGRPLKGPRGVLKFNLLESAKPGSYGVPQPR